MNRYSSAGMAILLALQIAGCTALQYIPLHEPQPEEIRGKLLIQLHDGSQLLPDRRKPLAPTDSISSVAFPRSKIATTIRSDTLYTYIDDTLLLIPTADVAWILRSRVDPVRTLLIHHHERIIGTLDDSATYIRGRIRIQLVDGTELFSDKRLPRSQRDHPINEGKSPGRVTVVQSGILSTYIQGSFVQYDMADIAFISRTLPLLDKAIFKKAVFALTVGLPLLLWWDIIEIDIYPGY